MLQKIKGNMFYSVNLLNTGLTKKKKCNAEKKGSDNYLSLFYLYMLEYALHKNMKKKDKNCEQNSAMYARKYVYAKMQTVQIRCE